MKRILKTIMLTIVILCFNIGQIAADETQMATVYIEPSDNAYIIAYTEEWTGNTVKTTFIPIGEKVEVPVGEYVYISKIDISDSEFTGYELESITVNGEEEKIEDSMYWCSYEMVDGENIISVKMKEYTNYYKSYIGSNVRDSELYIDCTLESWEKSKDGSGKGYLETTKVVSGESINIDNMVYKIKEIKVLYEEEIDADIYSLFSINENVLETKAGVEPGEYIVTIEAETEKGDISFEDNVYIEIGHQVEFNIYFGENMIYEKEPTQFGYVGLSLEEWKNKKEIYNEPEMYHYDFMGWYDKSGKLLHDSDIVDGDSVYARFAKDGIFYDSKLKTKRRVYASKDENGIEKTKMVFTMPLKVDANLCTIFMDNIDTKIQVHYEWNEEFSDISEIWIDDVLLDEFSYTSDDRIEIDEDILTQIVGSNVEGCTYYTESTLLPRLKAPSNVSWDQKNHGTISWTEVEGANNGYQVSLYLNEIEVSTYIVRNKKCLSNLSHEFYNSGDYTVKVVALGDKMTGNSLPAESDIYLYKKPKEKVGSPSRVWWSCEDGETIPNIANWTIVPGAGGYEVRLLAYTEDMSKMTQIYTRIYGSDRTSYNLTKIMEKSREMLGKDIVCRFSVRALSSDIEMFIHSTQPVRSDFNNGTDIVTAVKDKLEDATMDTIFSVIEEVGMQSMAIAMQQDSSIMDKVETLEEEYVTANEIKLLDSAIESDQVDTKKMKVVGVGLNAAQGYEIGLSFKDLTKEEQRELNDSLYKNAIQLNIKLVNKGDEITGTLKCPISITMLPPGDLDADQLVILHYQEESDTPEYIWPVKNADNTITFVVTSFSDFIFANVVIADVPDDDSSGEVVPPNDDEDSDDDSKDDENGGNNNNNSRPSSSSSSNGDEEQKVYTNPSLSAAGMTSLTEEEQTAITHAAKEALGISMILSSVEKTEEGILGTATNKNIVFLKTDGTLACEQWISVNGAWYYFGADKKAATGWYQNAAGNWFYLNEETRKMEVGWKKAPDQKWYLLDSTTGAMKTGWQQVPTGLWYYLDVDGSMQTGWKKIDQNWYYLHTDGSMAIGWNLIEGNWYYLTSSGNCVQNQLTPDGYKVDENGVWISE